MSEAAATPTAGAQASSQSTENANVTQTQATEQTQAPARPESPLVYDEQLGKWVAKTKVDGKESVRSWDELMRDAQTSAAATKRFEEAKQIKLKAAEQERQYNEILAALRDPAQLYALYGEHANAMIEQLYDHAERERALSPEQRELRAYRQQTEQARLAEAERQRAEAQAKEDAEWDAAQQRTEATMERGLARAGVSDPNLTNHLKTVLWALVDQAEADGRALHLSEAVPQALESVKSMVGTVLAMMTPEERVQYIGKDLIESHMRSLAAPLPAQVPANPHHSAAQGRNTNGQFSTHQAFRPGTNPFAR